MGFEFDRFEKRRGQKDDRKSKAVKSIFKVKKKSNTAAGGRWSLIFRTTTSFNSRADLKVHSAIATLLAWLSCSD